MTENNLEFSIINNYTGGTFSEEIDNKIFELDVNELSDPINYENLGFYIFKVSEINKREVTQFSEAKDAITNLLALEEAYQDFDDTINILDEMLINDYSFEELSNAELNIKLSKNINLVQLEARLGDNFLPPDRNMPIGYVSQIIMNDNIAFIYNIREKKESYIPDLSEVINSVEDDYRKHQKKINLISLANNLLDEIYIQNEYSFEEYASKNNYNLKTMSKISRSNTELTSETIDDAFSVKTLEPIKIFKLDGEIGIGVITEIVEPKDQIVNEFYNSIKTNAYNNFNLSLSEIISSEIIENTSYEIYTQNIDQLFM